MSEILESFQQLSESGLYVLPLHPKKKAPMGDNWQRGDKTVAERMQMIKAQIDRGTAPNLGILGGSHSNNACVIDVDHNLDAILEIEEVFQLMSKAAVVQTGREDGNGRHIWIRTDEPLKTNLSWKYKGEISGEIRGGVNTVVPPSVHPDTGNEYRLISGSFTELPLFKLEYIKQLFQRIGEEEVQEKIPFPENTQYTQAPPRSNAKYRPDFQTIRWKDLFRHIGLAIREEGDKMHVRCPNEQSHTPNSKTIEHDTSTTIITKPDGAEVFSCLHAHCEHINQKYLCQLYEHLLPQFSEPWQAEETEPIHSPRRVINIPPPPDIDEPAALGRMKELEKGGLPHVEEYELTGFAEEWRQHILKSSLYPQPVLTTGAILSALGAVLGRRFITPDNLATNLMCIGLSGTSTGKNHILEQVEQAFLEADIIRRLTGGDFTSETALTRIVQRQPDSLLLMDEVAEVLDGIFSEQREITPQKKIARQLLEWYTASKPSKLWRGKEFAKERDNPTAEIWMPCVSLFGVTIPRSFYKLIRPIHVENGLLNRLLLFHTHDKHIKSENYPASGHVPEFVAERLATLNAISPNGEEESPIDLAIRPKPCVVTYHPDCQAEFDYIRFSNNILRDKHPPYFELKLRRLEQTKRIALILAASDQRQEILPDDVIAARRIVDDSIRVLEWHLVNNATANSEYYEEQRKLYSFIESFGAYGVPRRQVNSTFAHLKKKDRLEMIENLMEAEVVLNVGFQINKRRQEVLMAYRFTPMAREKQNEQNQS